MRAVHPLWALVGLVLCILLATILAPVFPYPLDLILFWAGWIGAVIFLVLGILWLARGPRRL